VRFFSFDEIRDRADCLEIAREIGLHVGPDGRCAATWRGGDNPTVVSVGKDGWHDFRTEKGGSVIDLVASVRFDGDIQQAQEWLGERLGLAPKTETKDIPGESTRYDELIANGYRETRAYTYTDADGKPVFSVLRLEHQTEPKQFLQRAASGRWSVRGLPHPLYNAPAIAASDWAIVVEGEKDADTLIAWGIPGTTNAGGAKNWTAEHTDALAGKDVVILPDNDEAGGEHFAVVAGALAGKARTIRRVALSSLPKGDVTDWRDFEGGTREKLLERIASAPEVDQATLSEPYAIALAKEANKKPFRNYVLAPDPDGGTPRKEPRHINDMIEECGVRFLGFPRRVGGDLFDHDRDSGAIVYMHKVPTLFAWMARKSKQPIDWARGTNYPTKEEFFEGVFAAVTEYNGVSTVPDWPRREDIYYSHGALPAPSENHDDLRKLVSFFAGRTPEDQVLIMAFFLTPLYYKLAVSKPGWCITSESPGSGKTTLATTLASLYGHPAVEVKSREFARDMQEVHKRLISAEGRQARVLLVDNLATSMRSEELSSMMTMPFITGRPSYGRNEESRPNNLTYVITANNATVDNDLSIRLYFIQLRRVEEYSRAWAASLHSFVEHRRWHIFADMIDILSRHQPFEDMPPATRFPDFEAAVLQPCCRDADEYCRVAKALMESRSEANSDEELGKAVEDLLRFHLVELGIRPDEHPVWLRTVVVDKWIGDAMAEYKYRSACNMVRDLARQGHMPRIHPHLRIWPSRGNDRRRGIMWLAEDQNATAKFAVGELAGKVMLLDGEGRQIAAPVDKEI
jgi:hypothetical protein